MDILATSAINSNVRELRDALGLSQHHFSLLANISRTTLARIESARGNVKSNSIEGIARFTGLGIETLSNKGFVPPDGIREELIERYKAVPAIYVILSGEPTMAYGIKYKLLKTDFLDTPKETKQIKRFFDERGWKFKGNSLHAALKRMPDLIDIQPHPTKKGTNVYVRKNESNTLT